MSRALIVVDIQNDFCTGGALAVPHGESIIPEVNQMMERFPLVIMSQDWHPANHHSFASQHFGKKPFETKALFYGEQVLWPDHCVQNTRGAAFHPDLNDRSNLIIRKGFDKHIDSYSAFFDAAGNSTGLKGFLQHRKIEDVYVCGLALDYCVKYTAFDAYESGFGAVVITDLCRGIYNKESLQETLDGLKQGGVDLLRSQQVL